VAPSVLADPGSYPCMWEDLGYAGRIWICNVPLCDQYVSDANYLTTKADIASLIDQSERSQKHTCRVDGVMSQFPRPAKRYGSMWLEMPI
jgi:hypothetical protein